MNAKFKLLFVKARARVAILFSDSGLRRGRFAIIFLRSDALLIYLHDLVYLYLIMVDFLQIEVGRRRRGIHWRDHMTTRRVQMEVIDFHVHLEVERHLRPVDERRFQPLEFVIGDFPVRYGD